MERVSTPFSAEPIESEVRLQHTDQQSPLSGEWDLLILTDDAEISLSGVNLTSTLFVCYDGESCERLKERGCKTHDLSDSSFPKFSSYEELYTHYAQELSGKDDTLLTTETEEADIATTYDNLRFKALEICGPILHVWNITKQILREKHPQSVQIVVKEQSLATILNALLKSTGPF